MKRIIFLLIFLLITAQAQARTFSSGDATPGESIRSYNNLTAAVTSIGSTSTTLNIDRQETITADITIPTTLTLNFLHGGSLNIGAFSIRNSSYAWQLSASGTNVYYLTTSGGLNPNITQPAKVSFNNSVAQFNYPLDTSWGFDSELEAGEWQYDDNDTLGYSTIYVRLPDSTDPDTKAIDYIQAGYTVTIAGKIEAGNYQIFYGNGGVIVQSSTVIPQWYGAVGDGSTDDRAAFHNMYYSLPMAGGKMYIPATGSAYMLGSRLNFWDKPFDLEFEAGETSPLRITPGFSDSEILYIRGNYPFGEYHFTTGQRLQKVGLQNVTIDGNARQVATDGIKLESVDNIQAENINIVEVKGSAIVLAGVRESTFRGGAADQTGYVPASNSGTATGTQSANTLQDTSKIWATNEFAGYYVTLDGGTGQGQTRKVLSNTSNTLTIYDNSTYDPATAYHKYNCRQWDTAPVSTTTTYKIQKPSIVIDGNHYDPTNNIDFIGFNLQINYGIGFMMFGLDPTETSATKNIRITGGLLHGMINGWSDNTISTEPTIYIEDTERLSIDRPNFINFGYGPAIEIDGTFTPNSINISADFADGQLLGATKRAVQINSGDNIIVDDSNVYAAQADPCIEIKTGVSDVILGAINYKSCTTDVTDSGTNTVNIKTGGAPIALADLSDITGKSGGSSVLGSTSGTLTNGNCVEIDTAGNLVDAGAACGTGGSASSVTDLSEWTDAGTYLQFNSGTDDIKIGGTTNTDILHIDEGLARLTVNNTGGIGLDISGGGIQTDGSLQTGQQLEVNQLATTTTAGIIDLHADHLTSQDYEARIIRNNGANEDLEIINRGTGVVDIIGGLTTTLATFSTTGTTIYPYLKTVENITGNKTLTCAETGKTIKSNTSAAITVNLPDASTCPVGTNFMVVAYEGANSITIDGYSSQYIRNRYSVASQALGWVATGYAATMEVTKLSTANLWIVTNATGGWTAAP